MRDLGNLGYLGVFGYLEFLQYSEYLGALEYYGHLGVFVAVVFCCSSCLLTLLRSGRSQRSEFGFGPSVSQSVSDDHLILRCLHI